KRFIYSREARRLAPFERSLVERAHATTVVNEREAEALRRLAPNASIQVMPNGVDVVGLKPVGPPTGSADVVFCGVMNYEPNVEAVLWFANHVWPLVRRSRPDARFVIVGSAPVPAVRRLAAPQSGIEVTSAVPDVRKYLWKAAVAVAPIHMARGVQNK